MLRRSLAMMLALAMVITMFSGIVVAAEQTNKELLGDAGIIVGGTGGSSLDHLSWKREDVVVLLTRLYGETEEDMKHTVKTHKFEDVSNAYYDGFISWAVWKNLINGRSDTVFGFGDPITAQEFATLLLRVIGVDFEFKDAIETAVELKIMAAHLPNNSEVTRSASYDGIVNTLNYKDAQGVALGEKLGLKGWITADDAPVEAPVDAPDDPLVEPPVSPPVTENHGDEADIVELTIIEEIYLAFGITSEDMAELFTEMGIDVTINADRSLTLRMSKEFHTTMVQGIKDEFRKWMEETVAYMDSVKKMTVNDAFTELSIVVDQELFESKGDVMQFIFTPFDLAEIQMYDLVELADIEVKMLFINEKTGVIFDTSELENNY